ncbi:dihydrodipicolinate synthase family protein [Salinicola rhizosphaerae]|uniref:Dihydrodipicolinate synthase family protein n=1 Tax=Salinicola rhizosphaerae TaxID=1443141 RepID=A0ABQ3DVI4_9GAMM|nr:dihydrodipicolinate synthase family protein [Salinicola rhizosphaerae]GHB17662.1 dihydrodipicolinate synthase family protein [Salinicola rhizosphaerae]
MSRNSSSQSHPGTVLSPVITPFGADLAPDAEHFVRHCRWLMSNGVGLAIFGTNSEANSLSVAERQSLLERLVEADIDTSRLMPGTGCCAIADSVVLTRHAVEQGVGGVLMLPPFYYKGVSEEGLYRFYAEVIERVGDNRLRLYLYHIPPVAQVPITLALIERLMAQYPEVIAGVKDSGGDWHYTQAMIDAFTPAGFRVYAGSERFLLPTLRAGGAGCISATANVNARAIAALGETWQQADTNDQQQALNRIRDIFESVPMIPALKAATAHYSGDAIWNRLRPPLVELDDTQREHLLSSLSAAGFDMPGLST